jgi:molybdenum cofactor cytidylyltransferase
MRFGPLPLDQAEGAILAHSLALPDGGRLRKGQVLDAAAVAALRAGGHDHVTAARLDPGDLDEDAAALALARALVPDPAAAGMDLQAVGTGRVNIIATGPGLARIDGARVDAVNGCDPAITLATLAPHARLQAGQMVATVKIIPYGVAGEAVARACAAGQGALSRARPRLSTAALLLTEVPGSTPPHAKARATIAERLARLDVSLAQVRILPHDTALLASALRETTAPLVLMLTGSATSDLFDTAPQALRQAGGVVDHFGMPVDPGNLLFLGTLDGRAVVGLPGCARSPALNGADWVMERLICNIPVTPADIMGMGVGGLLKEIPTRPRPRRQSD